MNFTIFNVTCGSFFQPALIQATKENDVVAAERLLNSGIDLEQVDENHETALHWASFLGHHELVILSLLLILLWLLLLLLLLF